MVGTHASHDLTPCDKDQHMNTRLFHLHALSTLHCGTGQSAGVVDLPIARARATGLPLAPSSSIRGVLRDVVTDSSPAAALHLFGPETIRGSDDAYAGALSIGDAHLLLLPVRSLAGILCYATCPFILRRYAADIQRTGDTAPHVPACPADAALVTEGSVNRLNGRLVLEDLDPTAQTSADAQAWADHIASIVHSGDSEEAGAARADMTERFAILPDSLLSFLAETATEVRARIRINRDTGVVDTGALWNEENLPAESVLWGVYALTGSNKPAPADHPDQTAPDADALSREMPAQGMLLQLGGKSGVGRGLVRFLTTEESA
jgi:CRISPR-associated protein Cmr4